MDRTPANDSSAGADTPTLRCSHAFPQERTKLMAKVTQSRPPETMPEATIQDRDAVIAGATRIFREVGVTAEDLRTWAPWCPVLGELADAMEMSAGPR
jgi:hypothetical protein